MDFKVFDGKSDDGAELIVVHPGTGELTDVVITLAGMDSLAWRKASQKLSSQLAKRAKSGSNLAKMLDDQEESTADLLASVTLKWTNVVVGGKALRLTPVNAKQLYVDNPWLAEQVNAFVGNRANFFRPVEAGDAGSGEG